MKPDGNFKLSKEAKCLIASYTNKKDRDLYKKYAINAEYTRSKLDRVIFKGNEKE